MTIKKIELINKLGIYDNYSWNCTKEFKRYNICFGFNGSGKSTLSNLFNLISANSIIPNEQKEGLYKDLKTTENESRIKFSNNLTYPANQNQENKKIYVFNSNFVSNHVYDGTVGKMSKFNVKETVLEDPTINKLNIQIDSKNEEKKSLQLEEKKIASKFDEVKRKYNAVFREHFPKKQLRSGIVIPQVSSLSSVPKNEIEIIISREIAEFKLSEKQEELEKDIKEVSKLSFHDTLLDIKSISNLLKQSAKENASNDLTKKIELYKKEIKIEENERVEPWFKLAEDLLKISKERNNNICPVCKTDIRPSIDSLISEFSDFFDLSYHDFLNKLKEIKEKIDDFIQIQIENKINETKLSTYDLKYKQFLKDVFPIYNKDESNSDLFKLQKLFDSKMGNTSNVIEINAHRIEQDLLSYNKNIESLNTFKSNLISNLTNRKIDPIEVDKKIRNNYTDLIYLDLDGTGSENRIKRFHEVKSAILEIDTSITELIDKKTQRLKELKMESKKVAEYLAKLGITHFTVDLQEGESENNILIKYKGNNNVKRNLQNTLSEGEKTALAFAYFLSKVSAEVINKGQVTIVIDDPISSLDDNRLYNTAYLIHEEFKGIKQLFVFSHNMLFLKYINPFFKKTERETFFITRGQIEDLPASLDNFQSPYFYMLESLVRFANEEHPNYEEARKFMPNYIRRILETFFGFKYAQLSNSNGQTPGLPNFIFEIIDFDGIEDNKVGDITKLNVKNKLHNINKVCDSFSHGNMQQLDECNFLSDQALKELSTNTLDIIGFFDSMHKNSIDELVKPLEIELPN